MNGESFEREFKRLRKKYPRLGADYAQFIKELKDDPYAGNSLGKSCRKIRMAIRDKNKGKTGGARVIAYVAIIEDRAILLTLYDKAERADLTPGELEGLLAENGLE